MKNDFKQLILVICYAIILLISYFAFKCNPDWRIGVIAWNSIFLVIAPTIGGITLIIISILRWTKKLINGITFIISIVVLLLVSVLCFIGPFNIMMGV